MTLRLWQVAMYFMFLRVYTKALCYPALIGIMTMVGHLVGGVEGNPLTLFYSVAVALWSVVFLKQWQREQSELQFLWGTENWNQTEKPRKEFERN